MKGSSIRRKLFRLHTGVNRKSCATRWMGQMTVRVDCIRMKAREGAEKSCLSRRRPRGQRGARESRKRLRAERVVNAARHPPAPEAKTRYSRRDNHSARKYLWAVKAANRLASSKAVQRLTEKVPSNLASLPCPHPVCRHVGSSNQKYRQHARYFWFGVVRSRTREGFRLSRDWVQFRERWHGVRRRADALGVPPVAAVEKTPLQFLGVWSRACELQEWAEFAVPFEAPPSTQRGGICRSCGDFGHLSSACPVRARTYGRRGGRKRPSRGRRS
jgi:hypothetical protein